MWDSSSCSSRCQLSCRLSILYVRFNAFNRLHLIKTFSFQFSMWDSPDRHEGSLRPNPSLSILYVRFWSIWCDHCGAEWEFFQFSMWDSICLTAAVFVASCSLSILYVRFRRENEYGCLHKLQAFNSLCEIREDFGEDSSTKRRLSILYVRFTADLYTLRCR